MSTMSNTTMNPNKTQIFKHFAVMINIISVIQDKSFAFINSFIDDIKSHLYLEYKIFILETNNPDTISESKDLSLKIMNEIQKHSLNINIHGVEEF
jgi:hypothetical protein